MHDYDHNESLQLIPADKNLPVKYPAEKIADNIRIYKGKIKKSKAIFTIWKYLTLIIAFITVFLSVFYLFFYEEKDEADSSASINDSVSTSADETEAVTSSVQPERQPLTVINESGIDFDIKSYQGGNILSSPSLRDENGVRIMIVHSHSSEYLSENVSVSDAGIAISQLLLSAGIGTEYCEEEFDKNGRIGAYNNMKERIKSARADNPGLVLIIDLHSSDSGSPITFTVGTGSDYGWEENLRAAVALAESLADTEASIRLLPDDLGQNSGVVTLNIGICGMHCDDATARRVIASLVNAIIRLSNENPRNDPGMTF